MPYPSFILSDAYFSRQKERLEGKIPYYYEAIMKIRFNI